jgi:hypothetical protein
MCQLRSADVGDNVDAKHKVSIRERRLPPRKWEVIDPTPFGFGPAVAKIEMNQNAPWAQGVGGSNPLAPI